MSQDPRQTRQRKESVPQRVPTELLLLGYFGFLLLMVGAALRSEIGDVLANAGLLITIGAAALFFARWLISRRSQK